MFYSIAATRKENYSNFYQLGPFVVSTDNGWQQHGNYLYKGYADVCYLADNLDLITGQEEPTYTGNFTILHYNQDTNTIKVCTNRYRSYRLYYNNYELTNLVPGGRSIWGDAVVTVNSDYTVSQYEYDIVTLPPAQSLSIESARAQIKKILTDTVNNFYRYNTTPIMLFCSGGIDTTLLYAMLPQKQFTLVDYTYYKLDHFTTTNNITLSQYWGYKQLHYWNTPTVFATGSHGDEYFLRGPAVIAMLTSWHNINFGELLDNNPTCYHYKHFIKYSNLWKSSWDNRKELQQQYPTEEELHRQIINLLLNDHQHWHLGNTITWTLFKDIELVKILLQCPIHELLPQFLNAQLTKDLITEFNSDVLDFVSTYKNHNSLEYLYNLIEYHNRCI